MARRNRPRTPKSRPDSPATSAVPQPQVVRTASGTQRFYVEVENLMAQPLDVSVLNESGAVEGLRLAPRGKSRPIEPHRVGSYTRSLAEQGRVRIVPVG